MTVEISPEEFLAPRIEPLKMGLFYNVDGGEDYVCAYSNIDTYKEGATYSVYKVPSLTRLIGKRLQLFTQSLQEKMATQSHQLPVILRWEKDLRQILILQFSSQEELTEDLQDVISDNKEKLRDWLDLKIGYDSTDSSTPMDQKLRTLPRYNTLHLKPVLKFQSLENFKFFVKDISLGGIQIYAPDRFTLRSFHEVQFQLGQKPPLRLNVHQVWQEEDPSIKEEYRKYIKDFEDTIHFRSGFKLKFHVEKDFKQWQTLIYALHEHQKLKRK